ncbi:hypothetical protein ABTZ21_25865 [Streptomyces sp. NPDC096191]|uniref:hypothetical protein n=1 Tax=Streptomyces sp. NPDC096191 TaxID=3155426 RepID=UPI00332744B6
MFDPESLTRLREEVRETTVQNRRLLERLLAEVEVMRDASVRIQPRTTTSISLVASDGGNNRAEFNPFELQIVRVMDSHGVELMTKVVSPHTDLEELAEWHLSPTRPDDPLGLLMRDLGCRTLYELSPMLNNDPEKKSPGWPLVYRDLCEWAVLYQLITTTRWGSDTLIVRDGLLRSKIFQGDLFVQMYRRIMEAIEGTKRSRRRDVYLVGIAKHTEVLQRYSTAMSVQQIFPVGHPLYAPVPYALQKEAYKWPEYIRSPVVEEDAEGKEDPKFNIGSMHFVRFGSQASDPIWTADLLHDQAGDAQKIFGCLLGDAVEGFPVPFYPLCLQRADEYAHVVGLDMDILRDELASAVRDLLGDAKRQQIMDGLMLAYSDIASRRYA